MLAEALHEQEKTLDCSSVMILGVAYKPDVNEARETPAIEIIRQLQQAGAKVSSMTPASSRYRWRRR
jgi:UDP-N-acetyl-D-glucosamine dehydrogenase